VNQRDLDILLREGEGSMLEYKESLSSSLARELAAFANSAGGKILVGVRNDGTVVGMRDTNDLRAQIQVAPARRSGRGLGSIAKV
jgi:ATP-dependent DNA helicase RecG